MKSCNKKPYNFILLLSFLTAGLSCQLIGQTTTPQDTSSPKRLFENLLPSAPDEEATWIEVQGTFAQVKEELASFDPAKDDIKTKLVKTCDFIWACITRACKLLQCEYPKGFTLFNKKTMDSRACANIKDKVLGIQIEYLTYIVSASNLEAVRYRYYEFVVILMHELGHLQQKEISYITKVIDKYGLSAANYLICFGAILEWTAIGLNSLTQNRGKYNSVFRTGLITSLTGLIPLLSLFFVRHKQRQREFEADESILKGTHYHKDAPFLCQQTLIFDEKSEKYTDFQIFLSILLGENLGLSTHPTPQARAQHLRDLIKKHQAEIKSEQQKK